MPREPDRECTWARGKSSRLDGSQKPARLPGAALVRLRSPPDSALRFVTSTASNPSPSPVMVKDQTPNGAGGTMCFVRGDLRTADHTVRYFVRPAAPVPANDNLALPGRTRRRFAGLALTEQGPRLLLVEVQRAATRFLGLVAISGGVWLAMTFAPMIAGVFG